MLIEKLFLEDLLSVDKLHYKEVKIINDLHDLVLKKDIKKIDIKLGELVADVEHHFQSEEEKMFSYDYPDANKHQFAHGMALRKLLEVKISWDKDKDPDALKQYLENILLPWLKSHLMTMDKNMCEYLITHGSN